MPTFLVVGKRSLGLARRIIERGDNYILLQQADLPLKDEGASEIMNVDLFDLEALKKLASSLKGRVDAVLSVFEEFVEASAILAESLGLPGNRPEVARQSTDKVLMRQKLSATAVCVNPAFTEVKDRSQLEEFATSHEFPLVLKPASLIKSLLVTKSNDLSELEQNYTAISRAIEPIYSQYAPGKAPKIILEEFLQGTQHSVAAFADRRGEVKSANEIADIVTAAEAGFEDTFLYSRSLPSRLSRPAQVKVIETATSAMKSLGLRSCPAHVEIMLTPKGPMVIEIAARIGGYRQRMYQLASGIDLSSAVLDTALGAKIDLESRKNEACAVVELFPKKIGAFQIIRGENRLRRLESLHYFSVKNQPGDKVGKSSAGFKAVAVIILHNPQPDRLKRDLEYINKNVEVVTV
ncbi:MAG TPA: ATP-grasp domain-containing protein [Candidatus Saccharimonadales bacterium]|nr:ATP-grasp domain-containing protein [Candidatus Saccharimonadales bacterium]